LGSATASLENALNSLPSKPSNLTFSVTGTPGNYVITMVDSNAIKSDQPPLEVVAVGGATAAVTTLVDGGSNGGYGDTESIHSLNMVIGGDSSAQVEIGAGATLSLGSNVNLTARPGLPVSAPSATIGGGGSFSLLSSADPASATRSFALADGPNSQDLVISANLTNGVTSFQTQTVAIGGSPNSGSFVLSGGPLVGATTNIPVNATADEVRSAVARVLPSGVSIFVKSSGTRPNFTYTITFLDLPASAAAMTFSSNLLNKNTGAAGTGVVKPQTFTRPQGSIATAGSLLDVSAPGVVGQQRLCRLDQN
jgi:hypothetical protein